MGCVVKFCLREKKVFVYELFVLSMFINSS